MSLVQPADGSAALSLGTDLAADEGWALSARYVGRFGEGARDHGFLFGGQRSFKQLCLWCSFFAGLEEGVMGQVLHGSATTIEAVRRAAACRHEVRRLDRR